MPRPRSSLRNEVPRGPSPTKTIRIPLNDDDTEKAQRIRAKNLLHKGHRNSLAAAAATPRKNYEGGHMEGTPKTPRNVGLMRESLNPITPLRKQPTVVNYEEWMKMHNDNKINPTNSWNFALIDYFHEMSLLKEGDGINFQKASCTLDGCVKIYGSRVDSVATETGKLLSGLADSSSKKKGRGNEDGEEGEEGEDGDEDGDGEKSKKKKRVRSSEATLAKDFSAIQLKKMELEFSVDPLFKKASADFDEGGAKGLLLNHLAIDNKGRVVFDSSEDIEEHDDNEGDKEEEVEEAVDIDLNRLRNMFLPDLNELDNLDICPALKNYDIGNPTGTLDLPFLEAKDDAADKADSNTDFGGGTEIPMFGGFDDDDDDDIGFPGDGTMAFGENVVWADQTANEVVDRFLTPAKPRGDVNGDDGGERVNEFAAQNSTPRQDDILSYFDEALRKNWAGPEHWKIKKIKDVSRTTAPPKPRRVKEQFEIDFMDPVADPSVETLLPQTNTQINMPKAQRKAINGNLLPDDKHFNSRQLVRLFLKPKETVFSSRRKQRRTSGRLPPADPEPELDALNMNEEFWAKENMAAEILASSTPEAKGNYDANFFNDEPMMLPMGMGDDDDDDFVDARDAFSPARGGDGDGDGDIPTSTAQTNIFGTMPTASQMDMMGMGSTQILSGRRIRPEYVQYAKVPKKVDVRKLKENMWQQMELELEEEARNRESEKPRPNSPTPSEARPSTAGGTSSSAGHPRQFTDVISSLQRVYPKETMSDISTSYCFICLLHLANEKGLVLHSNETMTNIMIEKDLAAEGPDGY